MNIETRRFCEFDEENKRKRKEKLPNVELTYRWRVPKQVELKVERVMLQRILDPSPDEYITIWRENKSQLSFRENRSNEKILLAKTFDRRVA